MKTTFKYLFACLSLALLLVPCLCSCIVSLGGCTAGLDDDPTHTHVVRIIEAQPATCLQEGWTEGKICTICCAVCGIVFEDAKEIPPLGHEFVNQVCVHCECSEYHLPGFNGNQTLLICFCNCSVLPKCGFSLKTPC